MGRAAALVAAVIALAGCGDRVKVPPAPVARAVPAGYRATQIWHANLTGAAVPDVIVASAGPPITNLEFHSADLRVLSWDALGHRWYIAFDAQKLDPRNFPNASLDNENGPISYSGNQGLSATLLDPKADVQLGAVAFANLIPGVNKQLVFSASMNYGGSGVPVVLAVIDFQRGFAAPRYVWNGEDGGGFSISGDRLRSVGAYWTATDAHCCPVREYHFTVTWKNGLFTEIQNDLPWLGVVVHAPNDTAGFFAPDRVQMVWQGSPAFGRLAVGDELLSVTNPHRSVVRGANGRPSTLDELELLHPGDTAHIVIRRNGSVMTIDVPLGSMKDAHAYELGDSELLDVTAL